MSIQPAMPHHLMTVAEYLEIGEVESGYTELAEGRLVSSPNSKRRHSRACSKLWRGVEAQLPPDLEAVEDVDVDLQLAAADQPAQCAGPI